MAIKEERTFEDRNKLRDRLSEEIIKNGMKVTDNMDGQKKADEKLMASTIKEFSDADIVELKNLGYGKALKDPSILSSKGRNMGIKILKDILKVNQQR